MNRVPLPGSGSIGLVACPGWHEGPAPSPATVRLLQRDVDYLAHAGARLLVTLLCAPELERIGATELRAACSGRDVAWAHLPIVDMTVPGADFERAWPSVGGDIHDRLDDGQLVVLHCRAGLGRSGMIAARLLVERGTTPSEAMALVRRCRPGAIETAAQEAYVLARLVGSRPPGGARG